MRLNSRKVMMFVGKGGVGKTTISAATALRLAQNGKKTLIISTDPAPSLSDIFEKRINDRETEICKNLHALELGYDEVMKKWKEKFGDEIYRVITSIASFDRSIIDYVGSAPGIDEEFMLDYVHEIFLSRQYDMIVWDTAPTGHTLRLLKLPIKFIEHLDQANGVYLRLFEYFEKIKGTIRGKNDVLQIIRSWKRLAESTIEFMRSVSVGYTAVAIPEALSICQTSRLIEEFSDFGLCVKTVILNNVMRNLPDCRFCASRRKMQENHMNKLPEKFDNVVIKQVPLLEYEIKGLDRLNYVAGFI